MKWLKTYKLFESVEVNKTMIEDFLRDFSDSDIPVKVRIKDKIPDGMTLSRAVAEFKYPLVEVVIGDAHDLSNDLDLFGNIDDLTSLNDYLVDEGWVLRKIIVFTIEMENWHNDFLEDGIELRHEPENFRDFIDMVKKSEEENGKEVKKSFRSVYFDYVTKDVLDFLNKLDKEYYED